jgi:hypothetical protein
LGRRGFTGLSGWEAVKRTGFYRLAPGSIRLFPHNSTQVVDFPHLAVVSQAKLGFNMGKRRKNHRGTEAQSQRKLRTKMGRGSRFAKSMNYDSIRAFVNEAGGEMSILVRDGEIAAIKSQ